MYKISNELLQSTLRELDQAIYNHEQWYKELIRSVVCQLPHDQREFSEDAHRHCRFGQWYYTMIPEELHDHPSYHSMEVEHTQMHKLANKLLLATMEHKPVSALDYDNFASTLERLRLHVASLKHEIEETLYKRDPLTGVRNRVSMLSDLRYVYEMVKRHAQDVAVAILDIDHFKAINDNHGHPTGDKVLASVAEFLSHHTRPYDKIYRYGGEEFLICMCSTGLETAAEVLERLRDELSRFTIVGNNNVTISVTASFGVSMLEGDSSIDDAIMRADEALYISKRSGRNLVTVWNRAMHSDLI